jgi:hypothetical protein
MKLPLATLAAGEATGWAATATNEAGVAYSAYVWVICADVS